METELEKFEQVFYYKRRTLEEFINLMIERAEVEENYAKSMDRLSSSLAVFSGGPLADVMNGLKSYHAMKSEQSRTFATSLKEDVVDCLRNMLKKETAESKKFLNIGKKTDLDMKIILEKIETTRKRYITLNNEIEEAHRNKAFLQNLDNMDPNAEERRRNNNEKISRLLSSRSDCDGDLKAFIDEYNNYKKPFTDQCNSIVDHFKKFDANRLESFRDSAMKYFVFEISHIRNIQYDANRVIKNVENADFSMEISESALYRSRQEPTAMDFDRFKEMFIDSAVEAKNKGGIIFDKTQIPENLGITTAFKSIMGFFANPKASENKRREDEKKFVEKQWKIVSQGQLLTETDELSLFKLLGQDYNRRALIHAFSFIEINFGGLGNEQAEKAKTIILQLLQHFLIEAWQNKDWESMRNYAGNVTRLKGGYRGEEGPKTEVYNYLDQNLAVMEIFNNEPIWKEYIMKTITDTLQKFGPRDKNTALTKIRHEIAYIKHYFVDKERAEGLVKTAGIEAGLTEEEAGRLIDENREGSFSASDTSSQGERDKEIPRASVLQDNFDNWMEKMEQKITDVEKTQRRASGIFSATKKGISDPTSPNVSSRIFGPDRTRDSFRHTHSEKGYQASPQRLRKRIFDMEVIPGSTDISAEKKIVKEEKENKPEISQFGSMSTADVNY